MFLFHLFEYLYKTKKEIDIKLNKIKLKHEFATKKGKANNQSITWNKLQESLFEETQQTLDRQKREGHNNQLHVKVIHFTKYLACCQADFH